MVSMLPQTGAIWLGAIQGFAGVSVRDGELHLNPALPEQWQQLSFPLFWQGLRITGHSRRAAYCLNLRPFHCV